jgi:hypothetical protein
MDDASRVRLTGCASRQFGCAPTVDEPGAAEDAASYRAADLVDVTLLSPSRAQELMPFFQSAHVQPTEQQRQALDALARQGKKFVAARLQAGADSNATPVLRVTVPSDGALAAPIALSLLAGQQQDTVSLLWLGVTSHRMAPLTAPVVQLDRSQVSVSSSGANNYAAVAAQAQPPDALAFLLEFSNILVLDSIRIYATDPSVQAFFGRGPRFVTRLSSRVRRDVLADDALGQAADDQPLGRSLDGCHGGPSGCGTAQGEAVAALWPLCALGLAMRLRARLRAKKRSPIAAQIE